MLPSNTCFSSSPDMQYALSGFSLPLKLWYAAVKYLLGSNSKVFTQISLESYGFSNANKSYVKEILKTAIESNDWDMIKELLETLRYEGEYDDNDFSEYLDLDN